MNFRFDVQISVVMLLFLSFAAPSQNIRTIDQIEFIRIPAGRFTAGSPSYEETQAVKEHVLPVFAISRYEITTEQFCRFLNNSSFALQHHPQLYKGEEGWIPKKRRNRMPIHSVSYDTACAFCDWFSLENDCKVRLPGELEWERAARGDIHQAPYPHGWGKPGSSIVWNTDSPARVGTRQPNAFGLYDICGNLYEWCLPRTNTATEIPARGGAWSEHDPQFVTVYRRVFFPQNYRGADVGFRMMLVPGPEH